MKIGKASAVVLAADAEFEDIIKLHTPCEGPTKQCQFDCPIFGNCNKP